MVNFGKLSINNYPLVQAWNGLTRRIQTTVEHMRVTNTEAAAMARGHVIGLVTGQRQAELASSDGNSEWCGVMTEPTLAGATGVARISGYAYCLFEAGLDPAPVTGESAYLSATDGYLTNVGAGSVKVGVIGNAHYATDGACDVFLNHCCEPQLG